MNDERLLINAIEAREILNMCHATFYRVRKMSGFPKPRYINGRKRPMYLRKEIEEWVSNLK
jgi:predicted DNA-binding transcriptional regulator AlpA